MKIYVGNIPFDTSESDLRKAFTSYGKVSQVVIVRDKFTGESRGYAYLEMPDRQEAQAAIQGLEGKKIGDHLLQVHSAEDDGISEYSERNIT